MAIKKLKTIHIEDLDNTYEVMVDESQIEDGAVTEDKIADCSVTKDKLGADVKEDLTQLYNNAITNAASGAIASFTDGADDLPMDSVVCHINPTQSGSGDPSPDNVRPISGYIGITAHKASYYERCFPYNNVAVGDTVASLNGITVQYLGAGKYRIFGTATSMATCKFRIKAFDTLPRTNTTKKIGFNNDKSEPNVSVIFYDETSSSIDSFTFNGINRQGGFNTLAGKTVGYIAFYVTNGITVDLTAMIEFFDTADDEQVAINWQTEAGTVYGGTLDVVSGVLTVDRAIVDLGTLNWSYLTDLSAPRFWCALTNLKSAGSTKGTGDYILSPQHKSAPSGSLTYANYFNAISGLDGIVSVYTTGSNTTGIVIKDSSYTDAQTFKTAMSGVVCCYKLSAPTTYQLTPTEVKSLLGQNNIWHNCNGNTDAVYKADTKLYIDNKFAELQALILEN